MSNGGGAVEDKALTPRSEDFGAWYNELVLRAQLADYSPVRGSMVIMPYGYGIWEIMQRVLDGMFKATGHQNAYFPLLIPESYLEREKEHVEGFAPEVAVVTRAGGKELEEPLVIRPTSETIIYAMFAKWIQSHRDLPVLINQWANVVRWEMRTRLFLRTAEFLWQEGHTAHATEDEAEEEARLMADVYRKFMDEWMAMPPVLGEKTAAERFAGAQRTYSLEALMQDNRALQAGTSHNLGQNFTRQFNVKFQTEAGSEEFAWTTSWGVSTRLIGGLVMTHGDDQGLVVPPKLAPVQVVVVPIYRKDAERTVVMETARRLVTELEDRGVRVELDVRDGMTPGAKFYEWERKGVPFRVEIGPRDVASEQLMLVPRLLQEGEQRKTPVPLSSAATVLERKLESFQRMMRERALQRREENSYRNINDYGELRAIVEGKGGFVYTGWCGSAACEAQVKEDCRATIRALPFDDYRSPDPPDRCVVCQSPAQHEVVWARAY